MNSHEVHPDAPANAARFVSRKWLHHYENTGQGHLTILSGSMAPLINTGDTVFICKTSLHHICTGDIITFWKGDVLVSHRVIQRIVRDGEMCFIERGDTSGQHALCRGCSVIGRVRAVKKADRTFNFDQLWWKMCNRATGIGMLCVFILRRLGKKIPVLPRGARAIVRKIFAAAARLKNKALCSVLFGAACDPAQASFSRTLDRQSCLCANASFANGARIDLFIPLTAGAKTMGLSGTRALAESQGMLFTHERDDFWGIWMKEMNYPIDILWLDTSRQVVHIETGVDPSTFPQVFTPPVPARYVLEVAAGVVKKNNVQISDHIVFEH